MSFCVRSLSDPCLSRRAGLTRMAGICSQKGQAMSAPDTALLVIDAQESFRHRPYWISEDVPAVTARLQAMADGARAAGIPIVQIFHVEPTGPFSLESGNVRTMTPLSI